MSHVGRSGPVSGRPVSDREERADAGKAGPVAAHLKADGVISGAGHMAVGGLSFPGAEAFSERGVSKSAVFPRLGILRDASDPFPDARFPAGRGGAAAAGRLPQNGCWGSEEPLRAAGSAGMDRMCRIPVVRRARMDFFSCFPIFCHA